MGAGITITVNAATAEAAANLVAFVNQTESGLKRIEQQAKKTDQATQVTAGSLKSAARVLSGTASNLAYTAGMFAGPQVQAALYPAMALGKEIKGVSEAMHVLGVSAPVAGSALVGLTLAVWTGAEAWKAYKARAEEARNTMDTVASQDGLTNRLRKQIDDAVARAQMSKEEGTTLKRLMFDGGKDVMSGLGDNASSAEITKALQARAAAVAEAQAYVRARLAGKVASEQEVEANQKLFELNKKYYAERLDGFEKERYEAEQARLARLQEIEANAKAAGRALTSEAVTAAYENAREAHAAKMADIANREKEAEEEKIEEARKYFEEQNKMNDELHEKFMKQLEREKEEKRRTAIDATRSDWRLTDEEKYRRLKELGVGTEELGPDANSITEQFEAGFLQLQHNWGTLSQHMAGTFFNAMDAAFNGISRGIEGLILGTMGWGNALRSISQGVMQSIIRSISDMAAQWITSHLIMRAALHITHAIATALRWKEVADVTAAEMAKKPALLSNATLASIGSFGIAVAAGIGLMMAAMAAFGGMREGGGPVQAGKGYIVGEKRAELFVPEHNGYIYPNVPRAMPSGGPNAATAPAAMPIIKNIFVLDMKAAAMEAINSPEAAQVYVHRVAGNRLEAGFNT